jgi:hypothetical protein
MEEGEVQPRAELEGPEEVVAEFIRLLNNAKSRVLIVTCKRKSVNSSRIEVYVSAVPFFPHGSKAIVYYNRELPFFIGFSSLLFPELAGILTAVRSARGCADIIKGELEKESNLATLTWLVSLLEEDEKFRSLIETLTTLNSRIKKYGRERDRVKYVRGLLESLG